MSITCFPSHVIEGDTITHTAWGVRRTAVVLAKDVTKVLIAKKKMQPFGNIGHVYDKTYVFTLDNGDTVRYPSGALVTVNARPSIAKEGR